MKLHYTLETLTREKHNTRSWEKVLNTYEFPGSRTQVDAENPLKTDASEDVPRKKNPRVPPRGRPYKITRSSGGAFNR